MHSSLAALAAVFVGASVVAAPAPLTGAVAIARLDVLWAQRKWPDQMEESVSLGQQVHAADPRDYEVTWRTARALWWSGHTAEDQKRMRRNCYAAAQLAEEAAELRPDRVEGHYYVAIATGEYATTIGVSQALWKGVGPKIERAALEAYDADKHYDNGGPMTTLGRFYAMLPWPLQDLDKSRAYLEELRAAHPNALLGRFYLAETYYKRGELAPALQELDVVVHTPVADSQAMVRPSARELAAQRLAQWFYVSTPPVPAGADDDGAGRTR